MIKYTPSNQLTLEGFSHPFEEELSPENRWVKLAKLIIPWDSLAAVHAKSLSATSGRESIDVRMVIGALTVKHKLGLDDRGTVAMISENLYLQYFCGLQSFQVEEPFHRTVLVDIRKRMGAVQFDLWNERIVEKADPLRPKREQNIDKDDSGEPTANKGKLKVDATVADQRVAFPTDAKLLNRAREESERTIDRLYKCSGLKNKPRDRRRVARKEYVAFSKKRNKTKKQTRKFIGRQLRYLKRNLGHTDRLLDTIASLRANEGLPGMLPGLKDPFPDR